MKAADPIENARAALAVWRRKEEEKARESRAALDRSMAAVDRMGIPFPQAVIAAAGAHRRLARGGGPLGTPWDRALKAYLAPPPAAGGRVMPLGSYHYARPVTDLLRALTPQQRMAVKFATLLQGDALRWQLRRVCRLRRLRGTAEALTGIEWDWPAKRETRWKPRRIFDHEKDRWSW